MASGDYTTRNRDYSAKAAGTSSYGQAEQRDVKEALVKRIAKEYNLSEEETRQLEGMSLRDLKADYSAEFQEVSEEYAQSQASQDGSIFPPLEASSASDSIISFLDMTFPYSYLTCMGNMLAQSFQMARLT